MREEKYIRNQVVFNKGDEPQYLYIVQEGEFETYWYRKGQYSIMDLTQSGKLQGAKTVPKNKL